jgi:hypothetical protein
MPDVLRVMSREIQYQAIMRMGVPELIRCDGEVCCTGIANERSVAARLTTSFYPRQRAGQGTGLPTQT